MNLLKINSVSNKDTYRLIDQGTKKGQFDLYRQGNKAFVVLQQSMLEDDASLSYLLYLTEQITRLFHPSWIIIQQADPKDHKVLNGCGYYAARDGFKKKIDPWRLKLEDRIFDDRGLIIDQGRMQAVPFGWFSTREKGCGWIAAWNLLKLNGIDMPIEKTVQELSSHAFLGEVMGADIFTLRRYLIKKGLNVKITLPSDKNTRPIMERSTSGILLYHHLHGAHYIAYEQTVPGKFHFYNAVYGRRNHVDTLAHFLKTYEFLPISMALYMEKK